MNCHQQYFLGRKDFYATNEHATYGCEDTSLVPEVGGKRECLESGKWSGEAPKCVVKTTTTTTTTTTTQKPTSTSTNGFNEFDSDDEFGFNQAPLKESTDLVVNTTPDLPKKTRKKKPMPVTEPTSNDIEEREAKPVSKDEEETKEIEKNSIDLAGSSANGGFKASALVYSLSMITFIVRLS